MSVIYFRSDCYRTRVRRTGNGEVPKEVIRVRGVKPLNQIGSRIFSTDDGCDIEVLIAIQCSRELKGLTNRPFGIHRIVSLNRRGCHVGDGAAAGDAGVFDAMYCG